MKINSVILKQKNHGLQIYFQNLEKLLTQVDTSIQFERSYFNNSGLGFFFEDKKLNLFKQILRLQKSSDIIHIQYDMESLFFNTPDWKILCKQSLLCLFIRLIGKPTVITVHGIFDDLKKHQNVKKLGIFLFFKILLTGNTKIIFVFHSQKFTKNIQSLFPKYRRSFRYLPHLIYPQLVGKINKNVERSKKTKKLTTLGFIGPWKGQLEILQVLNKLKLSTHNFKYEIIGKVIDKEYYQQCVNSIKKNKLEKFVSIKNSFLSDENFRKKLSETDIYLSFHTREDQISSGTIIHALANEIPTICTSIPFTEDLKTKAKTLYIAKNSDDYYRILASLIKQKRKYVSQKNFVREINREVSDNYKIIYTALYERK